MSRGAVSRLPLAPRSVAMFSWDGYGGTPTARTGQAFHCIRTGSAWFLDGDGNLARAGEDQPIFQYDADTNRYGLLVAPVGVTNRVVRSQQLADASWTKSNLTASDAVGVRLERGLLLLSKLTDSSGSEGYVERADVSMTTSQVTGLSLFVYGGTAASSQVLAYDSGGTTRLDSTITWTAGVPSVAVATGTLRKVLSYGNGLYRLLYTLALPGTTGNGKVRIVACKGAANQGTVWVGGIQVQTQSDSIMYVPTTTATAGFSNMRQYWDFVASPRAQTVYLEYLDWGLSIANSTFEVLLLGNDGSSPRSGSVNSMGVYSGSSGGMLAWCYPGADGGALAATSDVLPAPAYRDRVEIRVVLDPTTGLTIGQSINGGTESTTTNAAAVLPTSWSTPIIQLGDSGSGNGFLATAIRVLPGVVSMANCRILK